MLTLKHPWSNNPRPSSTSTASHQRTSIRPRSQPPNPADHVAPRTPPPPRSPLHSCGPHECAARMASIARRPHVSRTARLPAPPLYLSASPMPNILLSLSMSAASPRFGACGGSRRWRGSGGGESEAHWAIGRARARQAIVQANAYRQAVRVCARARVRKKGADGLCSGRQRA